jgi:hypothetical protein
MILNGIAGEADMNKGLAVEERGVSETVGFMIIFGITLTGIAMVTLYGYPALLQEQQNSNIKNIEKTMLVLQSDLKSLTLKGIPYQETAIQVNGGTLKVDPSTLAHFTLNLAAPPAPPDYYLGELRFESSDGQTTVSLENGAVHVREWSSPNGSAMLATPSWYYDYDPITGKETYVLQIIKLEASPALAQTGIGLVKMELSEQLPPKTWDLGPADTIQYIPSNEYRYDVAWENYLRQQDLNLTETVPGVFTFNNGAKLVIKEYKVKILSL